MKATPPRDAFGLVGTVLEGKYRVDRVVAEGGFGVVYAGHHLRLDVPLAIKILKPNRVLNAESRAEIVSRFLVEARTTAKLRHANIAQALDTGLMHTEEFPEGVPWMALEWLDGKTLEADLHARRGAGGRSPKQAFKLISPVIDAIAYAHEQGIAHRDLKPSNIMLVTARGEIVPRVLDFGIAKLVEAPSATTGSGHTSTESAFVAFSPGYAAPEQVSRARTGFWTDVHALGLILSEMLYDAPPYQSGPENELLVSIVDRDRPTPGKHGVDVGPWEAILARALALSPRERYVNAGELHQALRDSLDAAEMRRLETLGQPPVVHKPAVPAPMTRSASIKTEVGGHDSTIPASSTLPYSEVPRRRSPMPWALGLILGLALVTFGVSQYMRRKPVEPVAASVQPSASAEPPPPLATLAPEPSVIESAAAAPDAGAPVRPSGSARVREPRTPPVASAPKAPTPPPSATGVTPTTRFE